MGGTGSKQEDQIITGGARAADGRKEIHIRAVCRRRRRRGAARGRPRQFDGQQSDRGCRSVESGQSPASLRFRQQAQHLHREGDHDDGVERYSDVQRGRRQSRVPDAARHLHVTGRHPRSGGPSTSICSPRSCRRRTGRNSWRRARSTRRV
jgi:hypothetical protein